jgi:hypothetical protein
MKKRPIAAALQNLAEFSTAHSKPGRIYLKRSNQKLDSGQTRYLRAGVK